MLLLLLFLPACAPCKGEACIAAAEANPERAMELLDRGCADGVEEICGEAARRREFGVGTAIDLPAASAAYQAMCDRGVARGCMAAGNMLRKGTAGADPARARVLIQRSCDGDDGLGCMALAQLEMEVGDWAAARAAAQRACTLGEPLGCGAVQQLDAEPPPALPDEGPCLAGDLAACHERAVALVNAAGGSDRIPEGRAALAKLCEGDFLPACVDYGFALSHGLGAPPDPAAAAALYERTCERLPMACHNLGNLLLEGRGITPDSTRAEASFVRACEGGEAAGCLMGGNLASDRGDGAAARDRWQRACDKDLPLGCANLGLDLLEPATGLPADIPRAISLIQRACEAEDPYGCAMLGRELMRGTNLPSDPVRGQLLLTRSCQQGVDAACEFLGLR